MTQLICYWLVIADCLIVAGSCFVLLWAKTYKEGVLGNVAFGLLIFSSVITGAGLLFGGVEYEFLPETIIAKTGTTLLVLSITVKHLRWQWFGKSNRVPEQNGVVVTGAPQKVCR